ncbi:MAG: extracellular solute-binding protein [Thermomicrobiales bacterium]|nr:extracellular solute-binding protein [Thermomicrobiales bacterium]
MTEKKSLVSTPLNRRSVLKGVAGTGLAVGLTSKSSKVFAAPAVLQGSPVEISYGTWFWEEPGRAEAWRALIEKFHTEQSEIRIKEAGANFNEFTNNVITQLQAGKVDYDVVQTTPDLVLRLLQAGVLEPLGSVLTANNITTLSSGHDYITVDGQPMGLDVVTVVFGLLYNQSITDAAGITTLPTTTDEWLAMSTELTERPNQFGMFSPHLLSEPESFWFTLQEWACPFGGTWATEWTPNLTSEPIMQAVSLFKQFYDGTFPQGTDDATGLRLWGAGQLAQQLIVSAAVNSYKATNPDLYPSIRSMSLPWASKQSIARIHPITVNNTSPNKDAAVEWITWLYKPENYRMLLTGQLDVIPAYEVGGLDDYFAELPWLDGYKDISMTTPPQMVGSFIFNNQEFGQIVINRVQEVLTSGRAVEEAMADAQAEAEELASNLQ